MVALWMCYATLVTALLAAGAWAADTALAVLGRPRRWAWAAAVAGGLVLPAWSAWRESRDAAAPRVPVLTPVVVRVVTPPAAARPGRVIARVGQAPRAPRLAAAGAALRSAAATAADRATLLDRPLLALWLLASTTGAAALAHGAWAVRRRGRRWRPAVVAGERVWLAADLGPALVGAVRPRMVLPTWLLDALDAEELRLVLAHERAHAAARDPLLLALALGALAAAPWNAALWLAARRLRFATEADCDRRVLRVHPDARRYAWLLVDVAERAVAGAGQGTWRAGPIAAALLDPPGLLEQRVRYLVNAERPAARTRRARAAVGAAATFAALVLACDLPRPVVPPASAASGRVLVNRSLTPPDSALRACAEHPDCRDSVTAFTRAVAVYQGRWAQVQRELRAQRESPRQPGTASAPVRSSNAPVPGGTPPDEYLRGLLGPHALATRGSTPEQRPFVWFLLDRNGRFLRSASGHAGMRVVPRDFGERLRAATSVEAMGRLATPEPIPADSTLSLDAEAVWRKFPSLNERQLLMFGWRQLPAASGDTVNVIWAVAATGE